MGTAGRLSDTGLPCPLPGACLRRLRADDLADFQAYRALPELGRYQGWTPQPDADALAFLRAMEQAPLFAPGAWVQLGIGEQGSDRLVGDLGIFLAEDGGSGEIGFTLAPQAQGRGIATAAVAAGLRLFFARTEASAVRAVTDTRNDASLRLLRRLGFAHQATRHAVFRGEACRESEFVLPRAACGGA